MTEAFKNALTGFSFDAAAGGAIRHLFDIGYDACEIENHLDFPVPLSRIRQEIEAYRKEKEAIEKGELEDYRIVKENGKFGKTYFRRVKAGESDGTFKTKAGL